MKLTPGELSVVTSLLSSSLNEFNSTDLQLAGFRLATKRTDTRRTQASFKLIFLILETKQKKIVKQIR